MAHIHKTAIQRIQRLFSGGSIAEQNVMQAINKIKSTTRRSSQAEDHGGVRAQTFEDIQDAAKNRLIRINITDSEPLKKANIKDIEGAFPDRRLGAASQEAFNIIERIRGNQADEIEDTEYQYSDNW